MKKVKQLVFICALILSMVLVLSACGSEQELSGTFVLEDDPMFTVEFSGSEFKMPFPYSAMGIPGLEGDFVFRGTFDIDRSEKIITFNFDRDALEGDMIELVEKMLEVDPSTADLFNDPDMKGELDMIIESSLSAMTPMIDMMVEGLAGVGLRYDSNFDRLYSDDGEVFIRR